MPQRRKKFFLKKISAAKIHEAARSSTINGVFSCFAQVNEY
jgi:hypothetical protein